MDPSHDMAEHVKKHIRVYLAVGTALIVGTILTVAMYYVHFESTTVTIAVALFIASVKASLVAGFFMHLISEKAAVYMIMTSTVFFVASLMALTLLSFQDVPALSS